MSHSHSQVAEELSRQLLQARAGGNRVRAASPLWGEFDAGMVYEVQASVAAKAGPAGAFKIARKPGQPVIMAPIFQADIFRTPATIARQGFTRIGIELEVGFQVLTPLPPAGAPDFAERAAGCVGAVPAIEIVDTRLDDLEAAPDLLKLADNQSNGGLVVGSPVRDWRGLDFVQPQARLRLGDQDVLNGRAAVPGGDAFETFCALAGMVGDHCGGLKPGHVVITGSLNGLPWRETPLEVYGEIAGLGAVKARFA